MVATVAAPSAEQLRELVDALIAGTREVTADERNPGHLRGSCLLEEYLVT